MDIEKLIKKLEIKEAEVLTTEYQDKINWQEVLCSSRCAGGHAGGHEHIMESIFGKEKCVFVGTDGNYQGTCFGIYKVNGEFILLTDYYGSCSGCDSYEDASDDDIKRLIVGVVNSGHRYKSVLELLKWVYSVYQSEKYDGEYYDIKGVSYRILECFEKFEGMIEAYENVCRSCQFFVDRIEDKIMCKKGKTLESCPYKLEQIVSVKNENKNIRY